VVRLISRIGGGQEGKAKSTVRTMSDSTMPPEREGERKREGKKKDDELRYRPFVWAGEAKGKE